MKQVIVGIYEVGNEKIQVILREGTGGDFNLLPPNGEIPQAVIGADQSWYEIVMSLFHEIFEAISIRIRCRYCASGDIGYDSAAYMFIMSHNQMQDILAHVAVFASKSLYDIRKAYDKWKKDKKKEINSCTN